MNLLNYLDEYFPELTLSLPLLYKWPIGIRFELNGDCDKTKDNKDSYFAAVSRRANLLYKEIFLASDYIFVVGAERRVFDWSPEAAKFRCRPQGKKLPDLFRLSRKEGFGLSRPAGRQSFVDLSDSTSREVVTLRWTEVVSNGYRYDKVLSAIANQDFPVLRPLFSGEVFFLDARRHLIMNMYDDRGMDVIAKSPETLQEIYRTFNEWILDYDRGKIDKVFLETSNMGTDGPHLNE